jgi:hypothetical protein
VRQVLKHHKRRQPIRGVDRIHAHEYRVMPRRRRRAIVSAKNLARHGPTDSAPIRETDSVPVIAVLVRRGEREVATGVREEIVVIGRGETVARAVSAPTTENLLDRWMPPRQLSRPYRLSDRLSRRQFRLIWRGFVSS